MNPNVLLMTLVIALEPIPILGGSPPVFRAIWSTHRSLCVKLLKVN